MWLWHNISVEQLNNWNLSSNYKSVFEYISYNFQIYCTKKQCEVQDLYSSVFVISLKEKTNSIRGGAKMEYFHGTIVKGLSELKPKASPFSNLKAPVVYLMTNRQLALHYV